MNLNKAIARHWYIEILTLQFGGVGDRMTKQHWYCSKHFLSSDCFKHWYIRLISIPCDNCSQYYTLFLTPPILRSFLMVTSESPYNRRLQYCRVIIITLFKLINCFSLFDDAEGHPPRHSPVSTESILPVISDRWNLLSALSYYLVLDCR